MTTAAMADRRSIALGELLDEVVSSDGSRSEPDAGWYDSLVMLLVDAVLTADASALEAAAQRLSLAARPNKMLSEETVGHLRALYLVAYWGVERTAAMGTLALEPSSHAAALLRVIAQCPGASNQHIAKLVGIDETEVARTGARLRGAGLAISRRLGRRNAWEVTPRGLSTLEQVEDPSLEVTSTLAPADTTISFDQATVEAAVRASAETLLRMTRQLLQSWDSPPNASPPVKDPEVAAFELLFRPVDGKLAEGVGQVRGVIRSSNSSSRAHREPGESEILVEMRTPALHWMTPADEHMESRIDQLSVVKAGKRWAVRREGARRAIRTFDTAEDAEAFVNSSQERSTGAAEEGHAALKCDRI